MSVATNLSDPDVSSWQLLPEQTLVVSHDAGHPEHGWVQQDPSRAWQDPRMPGRWLFLAGTSVNGTAKSPAGVPIVELFGSRAGDDWTRGFDYLGVFSADGLQMCDPELARLSDEVQVLYVCTNKYLLGRVVKTAAGALAFARLPGMPDGGLAFEAGSNAGKGFEHADGRYLLILNGPKGFTLTRELRLSASSTGEPFLLSYPAAEVQPSTEYRITQDAPLTKSSTTAAGTRVLSSCIC
jgi:hypothetical protein